MALSSELSPADIRAITGNDEFGGNGMWWILILFLFGWGRGGYGYGGGGASDNYVLASDFATIQRQLSDGFSGVEKGLDTVRNGLCDGFYTEAQLMNTLGMNVMQGFNTTQAQIAQCCCDNKAAIADLKYAVATGDCATQRAIENGTRDILENANGNARAILDALTAQRIEQKDAKIAEQAQMIAGLQLAASQAAQNQYLIGQLRPAPVPAFPVAAPYQFGGCGCQGA